MNEAAVQSHVRLEAANQGLQLWRNNVGAAEDATGRLIRYGLGNDSAQLNRAIKSSDLIGITPIKIEPHHVGQMFGVFTAFEIKASDWFYRETDERAVAQMKFIQIVRNAGGIGWFINDPAQIVDAIRR
jgi:hypothetical protein